jgi:hypothetical protein
MTEPERYDDPALARRVREWVTETAPAAAPERLVFAVMDEVERQPRRQVPGLGPFQLRTLWQYAALTLVIAVGVAAGTLAVRQSAPGASPGSSPVPTPTSTPVALPSLRTTAVFDVTDVPGPSAIGVDAGALYVGTPDGHVAQIDPASGRELGRTAIGAEPITITPIDGRLWVGSAGPDLVIVDPATHSTTTIAGAGGPYVLRAAGAIWVSRRDAFARIDPATERVVGTLDVPGHLDSNPAVVVGSDLWVGAGEEILRIALPGGAVLGHIPLRAQTLVPVGDSVLAIGDGTLYRLSLSGQGQPAVVLQDIVSPYGVALDGPLLWLAEPPLSERSPDVLEIDVDSGLIVSRTPLQSGPRGLALLGGSVWVATDGGRLVQLRAGP